VRQTLFLGPFLGVAVSTTHTITGAVVAVGAARKIGAIRWNIATNMGTALDFDHAGGSTHRGRVLPGLHIVALTCGDRRTRNPYWCC
jgi:hypothetical protein